MVVVVVLCDCAVMLGVSAGVLVQVQVCVRGWMDGGMGDDM